jgi:acetolactate synthase-1/2/3 large subunit
VPLGAKLTAPDYPVVTVCRDSCFMMNASAVLTAVEYNFPLFGWSETTTGTCRYAISREHTFGKDREGATSFKDRTGGSTADYAMMARSMGARWCTRAKAERSRSELKPRSAPSDLTYLVFVSIAKHNHSSAVKRSST